ncbi:hypothetical protein [Lysinibacillus sp. NPDC056232]|uniref:hypothetical protein n=1 Tax=Lysinibacillus sp. NPDC056232 TaxID=3345756 RepID=UPI0035DDBC2B
MANVFLHEYSGSKALAISSNELPKPNPTSFEQILKQLAKVEQTREEKKSQSKPSPNARAIQGFTGYGFYGEGKAKKHFNHNYL